MIAHLLTLDRLDHPSIVGNSKPCFRNSVSRYFSFHSIGNGTRGKISIGSMYSSSIAECVSRCSESNIAPNKWVSGSSGHSVMTAAPSKSLQARPGSSSGISPSWYHE